MNYQSKEIVFVDLGNPPTEVVGHEQGFHRPCLIVQSLNHLKLVIVLPITSQAPSRPLYTVVPISNGMGGLTKDSYILVHQIRTISIDRITKKIGVLDERNFLKVQGVLQDVLGL